MEHYSLELRELLRQTADAWMLERRNEEELRFTSSTFQVETVEGIHSGKHTDPVTKRKPVPSATLIKRCLDDLEGIGTPKLIVPTYYDLPELERLRYLIAYIDRDSFRHKSVTKRLEVYYYLGDVLASRGWIMEDNLKMSRVLGERKTKYIRRIAKRVYALFFARGIAHIYTVLFIRSTHLIQIPETDFYDHLIPAAREMRSKELTHE